MQHLKRWMLVFGALFVVTATTPGIVAQESGKLKVTVQYNGTGTVDSAHEITVWLFDTPNITPDTPPVATDVLTANGGSLNFSGLPKQVYLAAAFDEKGDYDGTSGPPPTGTPITIHGQAGAPAAIATGGAEAAVTVTFDDSVRMP